MPEQQSSLTPDAAKRLMIVRGSWSAHVLAMAMVAAAIAVRLTLDPVLGERLPYSLNYIAIGTAAALVGAQATILATLLSVPASLYFLLTPRGNIDIALPGRDWEIVIYLLTAAAIILLMETMHRSVRRARRSEALVRVTLASIGDAVITTDAHGAVTDLNVVAEHLTGWRVDDARGRPLPEVFRIEHEGSRQPVDNPALRALREDVVSDLAKHTVLIAKDGVERPIDDSAAPIKDDLGDIVGSVLVFRDIAARKADEKRVHRATEALAEANRRKEEFLAILAHELRNPLAPIVNALELLKKPGLTLKTARSSIGLVERQVRLMVRLIDDLIDVSRISRNTLRLQLERVDITAVVRSAAEACHGQFELADVRFRLDLPTEATPVLADPVRITQVITNLLNNACKFTAPGGAVWLTLEVTPDAVVVFVRDTGVGIEAEALPTVFDMFSQVDTAVQWTERGLGIGLSLVRQLMDLHGGSIMVHSDGLGKGSTFELQLPRNEPSEAPLEAGPPQPAEAMSPRRILIVDDNSDAADSLAMLLSMSGHEVRTAYDGHQAVDAAAQFDPEVVLLDIGLPGMSGHDVCRSLRERLPDRPIAIVALTGWSQQQDRALSAAAGFDAHMVKPLDYSLLLEWMSEHLPALPRPSLVAG